MGMEPKGDYGQHEFYQRQVSGNLPTESVFYWDSDDGKTHLTITGAVPPGTIKPALCANCKHWFRDQPTDHYGDCKAPGMDNMLLDGDGPITQPGTRVNFGCVLFEQRP